MKKSGRFVGGGVAAFATMLVVGLAAGCATTAVPQTPERMLSHTHQHLNLIANLETTHEAIRSGAWQDPVTWGGVAIPGKDAVVSIPRGIEVVVRRQETAPAKLVQVAGTLRLAPQTNTRLLVETIVVERSGAFVIGQAGTPVSEGTTAEVVFTDPGGLGVTPTEADPEALRRGLVSMGEVGLYGSAKTPYAVVAGPVTRTKTLALAAPVPADWRVGDTLVLPSTQFRKLGDLANEVREIESLAGNVVTVTRAWDAAHRVDVSSTLHVANLTRNVVLRSENKAISHRGHVMLMNCAASNVEYASFSALGRTDKSVPIDDPARDARGNLERDSGKNPRGRYPLHFHQCGLDDGVAHVSGSVVNNTPGWGLVAHTSRVAIDRNVVFDFTGAGFVAESGNELGSFTRNFAIGGRGNGQFSLRRSYLGDEDRIHLADFGYHGDGFWFQAPMLSVTDNIAAGNKGVGIFFHAVGVEGSADVQRPKPVLAAAVGMPRAFIPPLRGGATVSPKLRRWKDARGRVTDDVVIQELPLYELRGNHAYGNFIGLKIRYLQNRNNLGIDNVDATFSSRIDSSGDDANYLRYEMSDSVFWNNMVGVHTTYTSGASFKNLVIGTDSPLDTKDIEETWVGFESWHGSARDVVVDGMKVKGYPIGVMTQDPADPHAPQFLRLEFSGIAPESRIVLQADRDFRL